MHIFIMLPSSTHYPMLTLTQEIKYDAEAQFQWQWLKKKQGDYKQNSKEHYLNSKKKLLNQAIPENLEIPFNFKNSSPIKQEQRLSFLYEEHDKGNQQKHYTSHLWVFLDHTSRCDISHSHLWCAQKGVSLGWNSRGTIVWTDSQNMMAQWWLKFTASGLNALLHWAETLSNLIQSEEYALLTFSHFNFFFSLLNSVAMLFTDSGFDTQCKI